MLSIKIKTIVCISRCQSLYWVGPFYFSNIERKQTHKHTCIHISIWTDECTHVPTHSRTDGRTCIQAVKTFSQKHGGASTVLGCCNIIVSFRSAGVVTVHIKKIFIYFCHFLIRNNIITQSKNSNRPRVVRKRLALSSWLNFIRSNVLLFYDHVDYKGYSRENSCYNK